VTAPVVVVQPTAETNTRFAVVWALLIPVLTGAVMLVTPLGIAHWSDMQIAADVALVNAFSALVLAIVATKWRDTAEEPVAVQAALSAFLLALFAVSNLYAWWTLTPDAQQLVIAWFGAVLLLLAYIVRMIVFSPNSVATVARAAHRQGMAAEHRKMTDGSDLPGAPGGFVNTPPTS
jgi:hypothetical protein